MAGTQKQSFCEWWVPTKSLLEPLVGIAASIVLLKAKTDKRSWGKANRRAQQRWYHKIPEVT